MKTIILAGGSGTRLWPLSRTTYPKQFIQLFEDNSSLFQKTLLRNKNSEFLIVTNETQYFLVIDQAADIGVKQLSFVLEPVGRNTAPAIALACLSLKQDDIVLVTPSDHLINNIDNYQRLLLKGQTLAEKGFLVTFGITPDYPATGYGYIEAEGENVSSFKEKPDIKQAQSYLKKGNFFWNSGMFMFQVSTFLNELKEYAPDIYEYSKDAFKKGIYEPTHKTTRILESDMKKIPANSIDYAIMEKSNKVKMVKEDIGWSDLGSFDELFKIIKKDESNNAVIGKHVCIDSEDNLIISKGNKLIATIGLKDIIITETADAILVAKRGDSQKVKEIVQLLGQDKSPLLDAHLTVHRPWGSYTVLLEEPNRYKIKKIVVKPKNKLSLQKHFHRNEHWVVVSGTAKIQNGKKKLILRENESTYIPMGQTHRLENPGKIDLVMIEAQVGQYLNEDDIVRLEDEFNRV
ncbi:MAG: mannose-1-phosphate guanylyltransferase/mannose-6-phosphate isomerase [Candidatus Margulisbacteria bacterium]|nr:mannose-1-phosphate guanylyltransferase/mannose-6-phosphate isomerase [Candidatus Margulisiibacteriota bacterium]